MPAMLQANKRAPGYKHATRWMLKAIKRKDGTKDQAFCAIAGENKRWIQVHRNLQEPFVRRLRHLYLKKNGKVILVPTSKKGAKRIAFICVFSDYNGWVKEIKPDNVEIIKHWKFEKDGVETHHLVVRYIGDTPSISFIQRTSRGWIEEDKFEWGKFFCTTTLIKKR